MSEQDDSLEPQSKRLKCGDGDEEAAPEIIAFGGPMYDEATARKMLKEVRFEDGDEDEFQGFDPNDAALDNTYDVFGGNTPLIHFALTGDAKMCRYLISRGASTTKAADDNNFYFPMYVAALRGHLDLCKVLYENGAQNDVRRMNRDSLTPFFVASIYGHQAVLRWLVLHGALCADNNSEDVDRRRVVWINEDMIDSCDGLVKWAEKVTQTHDALITFLGGTLPPAPDADHRCMLQCLSGHPGVRKHISNFVGLEVTTGKHLRILQSVKEVLPALMKR